MNVSKKEVVGDPNQMTWSLRLNVWFAIKMERVAFTLSCYETRPLEKPTGAEKVKNAFSELPRDLGLALRRRRATTTTLPHGDKGQGKESAHQQQMVCPLWDNTSNYALSIDQFQG